MIEIFPLVGLFGRKKSREFIDGVAFLEKKNYISAMSKNDVTLLVLAAGLGSRFKGDKQVYLVSDRRVPLVFFAIEDAVKSGVRHVVIVTRREFFPFFEENIISRFPGVQFDLVVQQKQDFCPQKLADLRLKPWGTAHAVLCAKNKITGRFFVINADDYYGRHAINATVQFLKEGENALTVWSCVGYMLKNTLSENGPVSRGIIQLKEGYIEGFCETHGLHFSGQNIVDGNGNKVENTSYVSLNLFGVDDSLFPFLEKQFSRFLQPFDQNPIDETLFQSVEFGLPQNIAVAGKKLKMIPTLDRWVGMTFQEDLQKVNSYLNTIYPQ